MKRSFIFSAFLASATLTIAIIALIEYSYFQQIEFDVILDTILTDKSVWIGFFTGALLFIGAKFLTSHSAFTQKTLGISFMTAGIVGLCNVGTSLTNTALDLPKIDHSISCIDSTINNQKVISCSNGYIYPIMTSDALDVKTVADREALFY